MKVFRILLAFAMVVLPLVAFGQDVFKTMFDNARAFSASYPQEKVWLHTDNDSYEQGDTIWYKAYVVNAADNRPTQVSKPLYVELLDQLGNVVARQVVEIDSGEARGQLPLTSTFLSGYFELRAYTKWMLSAPEPQYFSRVLPVYRRTSGNYGGEHQIAEYHTAGSMKNRPDADDKVLAVRFFPEGGRLVADVANRVGFEIVAADSGVVNASGILHNGDKLLPISALHNGIGSFMLTPSAGRDYVAITYKGKGYEFDLPKADTAAVGLSVSSAGGSVHVALYDGRSGQFASHDSLAVFFFSHGVPMAYQRAKIAGDDRQARIRMDMSLLPPGICRVAVLGSSGKVIADRFFFVYPRDTISLRCQSDNMIYEPFGKITCRIKAVDKAGNPLGGARLSVSVKDALNSDIAAYGDNVETGLLLTSDIKGYIPDPAFYLDGTKVMRRRMLDDLLLVRGWRKYDIEQETSGKPYSPRYMPETALTLHGRVKSLFGRPQKGIGVSVLAKKNAVMVAGRTVADDDGFFNMSLNMFEGEMDTYIQTRREGKEMNRWANVSIFRNFAPPVRPYYYAETHPRWAVPELDRQKITAADSAYRASLTDGAIQLGEITVKAKGNGDRQGDIARFERDVYGYYDIRRFVDNIRDEGKDIVDLEDLMPRLDKNIHIETNDTGNTIVYGERPLTFYVDGQKIGQSFFSKDINAMRTMIIYEDDALGDYGVYTVGKNGEVEKGKVRDPWSGIELNPEGGIEAQQRGIVCSVQMAPGWSPDKSYKAARGLRQTTIQGYERPLEFYSPVYDTPAAIDATDRRRTLYWNPSVVTDKNGEATVVLYNAAQTTAVSIDAETIYEGIPASTSNNSM